jgi:hypothetical protein
VPASGEAGTFPQGAFTSESEFAPVEPLAYAEHAEPVRPSEPMEPVRSSEPGEPGGGFPQGGFGPGFAPGSVQPGGGAYPQAAFSPAQPGGGDTAVFGAALAQGGEGRLHRWRVAFRGWRHSRPFWGGLLATLGGAEILLTYRAAFGVVLHFGLYGLAGYLVPAMLTLLGLLIVFDPVHRTFYSVLAVLAALGTWLTSNLGGFMIGMLLGLVGGSLAFGWQQGERRPARKRRRVGAGATG